MEESLFGLRYRATEKIGSGGMADVYKAVDEVLGRTVAVKVMHARFAADATFVARFRQEAQAAANLSSPNIVNVYDWGHDAPDTYYIVMEHLPGSDLKSIIVERGALPSRTVAEIGAQVCAALSAAHGYGVIHRDIKPHNVMVQPDGAVKVMDFGIARAGNSNLTQTGSVFGTAHYLSPEQAQGQTLTPASDLYSVGVMLYEAVTGRLPFDGGTPVAVALKQVNEEALPPHEVVSGIDPGLEAVIVKAMSKRPVDRHISADELRLDLRAVASRRGADVTKRIARVAPDTANEVIVPAAALASGATSVMPRTGASRSPVSPGRPEGRRRLPRRTRVWPWAAVFALAVAGLGVAWSMGLFGAGSSPVPNVVSTTRAQARTALEGAGFTLGEVKEAYSSSVKAGAVVSQSPRSSVAAENGSAVYLVLSKGREMVRVPDVAGMLEADAFEALRTAGLSPQKLPSGFNEDVPVDTVYGQDPVGDGRADKGSVVSYMVSGGPEPVVDKVWDWLKPGKENEGRGHR